MDGVYNLTEKERMAVRELEAQLREARSRLEGFISGVIAARGLEGEWVLPAGQEVLICKHLQVGGVGVKGKPEVQAVDQIHGREVQG